MKNKVRLVPISLSTSKQSIHVVLEDKLCFKYCADDTPVVDAQYTVESSTVLDDIVYVDVKMKAVITATPVGCCTAKTTLVEDTLRFAFEKATHESTFKVEALGSGVASSGVKCGARCTRKVVYQQAIEITKS